MKKVKLFTILISVIAIIVACSILPGCNNPAQTTTAAAQTTTAAAQTTTAAAQTTTAAAAGTTASDAAEATVPIVKKDVYNIAFIVKAYGTPWYTALEASVVAECKKIAEENKVTINVSTQQCNYDGAKLAEYMRTARMKKVDAMIIMSPDSFSGIPETIEANKAGIPIFTVMEKIYGGDTYYVSYDNVDAGAEAAKFLAEKLNERYGKAAGLIAELKGNEGSSPTIDRDKGFRVELSTNYPEMQIIATQPFDYDANKAITAFTNILQGNPKIDALFAHSDEGIQGAVAAMKSMKRFFPVGDPNHIICIACDAPDVGLAGIRANEQDGSIELSPPKLGIAASRMAWAYLTKGEVPPKETMVPWVLIDTPEKAADPNLWGNLYSLKK